MWKVYIVRCSDDTLYTGITTDIERRIKEHNDSKGAKYTRARGPVELVYLAEFKDRSEASKEEWRIKALSREEKLALIK
jgi:putative endonuclease